MTGITVGHHGERLAAIKHADEPDHRARLRQEATVLAKLDHPGVVQLLGFDEGPPATLRTTFVAPDSWVHHPPVGEARIDDLAVVVATLADLHDAGVTHGDLTLEHVIAGDHRPILCGLASAGPTTPERVAADRAALADLVADLAAGDPLLSETVADLRNPAVSLRAVARRLDTRSTTPTQPPRRLRFPSLDHRVVVVAGAVAVLALIGLLLSAVVRDTSSSVVGAVAPPPTSTTTTGPPAPTPTAAATATAPEPVPPDAPVVEHAGRRYAIGEPGDVVVLGDWTCDGIETPAVLRPSTGHVAVFTEWPAAGGQITAAVTTAIDGADAFIASDDPCPDVRVRTAGGSRLVDLGER